MLRAFWNRIWKNEPQQVGRGQSSRRHGRPATFRPRFELLEDRLNLSNIINVTNSTDINAPGSLRFAIEQANLSTNTGATIVITPQVTGPINLTHGALSIQNSMTIENDSGAPLAINQNTHNARVFQVSGNRAVTVNLSGTAADPLTIEGGAVNMNSSGGDGAGILASNSSNLLTLTDVNVVDNNAAASGGGVYTAGSVVLNQSTVGSNAAGQLGGGLWSAGAATLNGSTVQNNQARVGGGGLFVNYGTVSVASSSSVDNNSSATGQGGGISVATGTVDVSGGSHVDDNEAFGVGGIMVGNVISPGVPSQDIAASITGGSTVNGNSSTGGAHQSLSDLGGGGIAALTFGNVDVDDSQVSNNSTVGMFSGGIVVGLGSVTVTDGSQIDGNTNNGPGGGIAANFGGTITVAGNSQVNGNTGGALGGGIVNFASPVQAVNISGNSQVDNNILTNGENIARVVAVFAAGGGSSGANLQNFVTTAGGKGGAAMAAGLALVATDATQLATTLQTDADTIGHPLGVLVAGGGIATLAAPVSVTGGSQVSGNLVGQNVLDGNNQLIGLGGGIFDVAGAVTVTGSAVNNNQAPSTDGDGGGIWIGSGSVALSAASTVNGNTSAGLGGGLFNATGQVTVSGSTLQSNTAVSGGGISSAGTASVTDSSISDNTASSEGGGVYNGGTYTPVGVIYAGNSPDDVYNY